MNATRTPAVAWTLALIGVALPAVSPAARGQGVPAMAGPGAALPPAVAVPGPDAPPAAGPAAPPPIGKPVDYPGDVQTSPWIAYHRPNCCGPVGRHGPITYELYGRAGPSFVPSGADVLAASLETGWAVQGGARTLLFNTAGDAAWVFDVGIAFNRNDAINQPPIFTQDIVRSTSDPTNPGGVEEDLNVRVSGLTRTGVTFGLGRDWFVYGPAFDNTCDRGNNLRFGTDGGVRYGSAHVDLDVFNTDGTMGYARENGPYLEAYIAVHGDYEVPMGSWSYFVGARFEYGHTWSNLLPARNSEIDTINLLVHGGVRF